MSCAEGPLSAPSERELRRSLRRSLGVHGLPPIGTAVVASSLLLPLLSALLAATPLSGPVAADPLASAQAEAAQLSSQIQAEGQHLEVLSQQYDAAEQQVQSLASQVSAIEGQIQLTKQKVSSDRANLRDQALSVYMSGTDEGLDEMFAGQSVRVWLTKEYSSVAAGNLSGTIDALHVAQLTLSSEQTQLQATESRAQSAAAQVAGARTAAEAAQATEQQTLNQVKGQIAVLVAQQQAAEERAQQEAFQARLAAEAAAQAAAGPRSPGGSAGSGAVLANLPVAPGGGGAVQAAKTQIGVPYVWGGETPGVGFDCSGLTQWAWRQAGVSLPRTAQAQYDAIEHVPLSDLEPGDLVFWDDGTSSIQHVAIYVGGGEVIQAPETGEDVGYAAIWDNGLVGAGRP